MTQAQVDELADIYKRLDILREAYETAQKGHREAARRLLDACDHLYPNGDPALTLRGSYRFCVMCHRTENEWKQAHQ